MLFVNGLLCLGILNSSDQPMLSRPRECTLVMMTLIWRHHYSYSWRGREVGCPRGECFTKLQLLMINTFSYMEKLKGCQSDVPWLKGVNELGVHGHARARTMQGRGNQKSYFNRPTVLKELGEQCRRINQSHLLSLWECICLCVYVAGYVCGIQKSWTSAVILQVLSTLSVLRQALCGLTKTCWVG